MSDGYSITPFSELVKAQQKEIEVISRIERIRKEIKAIEPIGQDWIVEIPSLDPKVRQRRGIKNSVRLSELKKELTKSEEELESNKIQIRIFKIENVLNKINTVI